MDSCRPIRWIVCLLLAVGLLACLDGCTRRFYRNAADKEVNDVLAEKDKDPRWKIEQYHVYADPRARFADSTNPDRPPQPPDDPFTSSHAPKSQGPGHAGVAWVEGTGYMELIRQWDAETREQRAAALGPNNPEVLAQAKESSAYLFPVLGEAPEVDKTRPKPYLLSLEQCTELGVINARPYQDFREELYEAALPATLQRFSFAFQFAATENAIRTWAGTEAPGGPAQNWNLGSAAGFSKMFSTGALLTFDFANTTVFNFLAGTHNTTSQSTINLNIVQPLLQGGGKAVILEPLNAAERSLVYAIRAYARFREQFFVSIGYSNNLPGSLATASGTAGAIGGSPISILAAVGLASTDVAGLFGGFMPTLYREMDMAADKKQVRELEKALPLFVGLEEGGQVSPLQVQQVTNQLLNARNTVLVDNQNVTNAVDQLKLQLGVPANLPLELDDTLARPITRQLERYYTVVDEADVAFKRVEKQDSLPPEKMRALILELLTKDPLVQGTPFQKNVPPSWEAWSRASDKAIKDRLEDLGKERRKLLDLKTDLEMKKEALSTAQERRLKEIDFESDLGGMEQVLRRYEQRPWDKLNVQKRQQARLILLRLLARSVEFVLVWARNDRLAQVDAAWPDLAPAPVQDLDLRSADTEEGQRVAVQTALANRWDLMNARAQVVDAWRQIKVTANALMGVFNLEYSLVSQTPPGGMHPLAFSPAGTSQQLILNPQLPLVRVAQRNAYRTALINYQVARRALMQLEDTIAADVRFDVRQLHLFAENYKIQQKVVQLNYSLVENSLEVLVAPPDPSQASQSGTQGQANAAALTTQYLTNVSGLNGSQTKMYDIWLSYLATRMQLYLDLELLSLDSRGVWTDEYSTQRDPTPTATGGATLGRPRPADAGDLLPPAGFLPPPPGPGME